MVHNQRMDRAIHLYEAIVTDANPDASMPGFIRVRIPELFGSHELPVLVGPIYPGPPSGGWQATPSSALPASDDAGEVRVLVAKLGPYSYRYIGTTQGWSTVENSLSTSAGARSQDGRHSILLVQDDGVVMSAFDGGSVVMAKEENVTIASQSILLTNDPLVTIGQPMVLGTSFLTGLQTFLTGCVGDAAMSPGVAAAAAIFVAQVTASLASRSPYLSSVSETV